MANKSFLIGISFLVGFCYVVYLAYDSNTKLRAARERVDYAKHEYETLSVQVQQLLDQKAKLEKQLQSERNELRKVKEDKDYIEQQRKDLFSKLQEFTQTEKTLKAQQADLKQSLEVANRELAELRAEKVNADQRNQAEFAQLGTQKDLEITKLRDQLADLKRRYDEAHANAVARSVKTPAKRNQKPAAPVQTNLDKLPEQNVQSVKQEDQQVLHNEDTQQQKDTPTGPEAPGRNDVAEAVSIQKNSRRTQPKAKDTDKRSNKQAVVSQDETLVQNNDETEPRNNELANAEFDANAEKTEDDKEKETQNGDQQLPKQVQPPVNVPAQQQHYQLNPPVPVKNPIADDAHNDNDANNQQERPPVNQVENGDDDAGGDPGPNDDNAEPDNEPAGPEEEKAQNQANVEAKKLHDNLADVDEENQDQDSLGRSQRRRRSN